MAIDRFQRFQPPPHLRSLVAEIDIQESSGPVNQSVLPELGLVLGFQFRGRLSLLDSTGEAHTLAPHGVTGLHEKSRTFISPGGFGSVLVRLEPWAGRHLLGLPAAEVTGLSLGLDAFISRTDLETFNTELAQASSDTARLDLVSMFLDRILKPVEHDRLTERAITLIVQRQGLLRIGDLIDELGTSHSPLVRRFQEQVGIGPKAFGSLVRLRQLLPILSSWQGNITDLAVQMGFHDQSHFIHEFRKMTGLSPRQYQNRDRWTESLLHLE